MYKLTVEGHFDAAHSLRGYQGKCENLHGHRFRVLAHVTARTLDDIGLACDFTLLKERLNASLARFDHVNLNETAPFDQLNPSSENLAATIYDELHTKLQDTGTALSSVEVWESPEAGVEYQPSMKML
jgi:6-pyruvoyltetrahydropterin/6-carboxytetrahydropterin synthase